MAFLAPVFAGIGGGAVAGGGFGLGSILSLGSGFLGAIGSLSSANAAKQAAEYNAKVDENQAITANQQAASRATEITQRTRQKMAAARAAGLENGLGEGGSTSDVLDTINKQGGLDSLTALYDGTVRATGLHNSAELERMRGRQAESQGMIGAFSSIFDGFSKAFG